MLLSRKQWRSFINLIKKSQTKPPSANSAWAGFDFSECMPSYEGFVTQDVPFAGGPIALKAMAAVVRSPLSP